MAERIIRGREIVADDFTRVADDAAIPADGAVALSLARFEAEGRALARSGRRVAVVIDGTHDARALAADLPLLAGVFVEFPKFGDGRGYSHARILRDELKFRGELRAVGDVLRDQIFYLHRCGFDAFAPAPGLDPASALEGLDDFSVTYQAAADDPRPIYARGLDRPFADRAGDAPPR